MGRIKTQLIKRVTNELMDRHGEEFTKDFEKNKELVVKFVSVPSKKIRNIIAGYVTRLVKEKTKEESYSPIIKEDADYSY
jgi:small subunit ribosomal protein S17e